MKNYKTFDVVELYNGNKATILSNVQEVIKVEEINNEGIAQGIREIKESEIKSIIFNKK